MSKHKSQHKALNQKIAAAKHRNEFQRQLRQFLDALAPQPVSQFIPKSDWDIIYQLRFIPCKVHPMKQLEAGDVKEFKYLLNELLKHNSTPLNINGIEKIALLDFFSFALTLMMNTDRLRKANKQGHVFLNTVLDELELAMNDERYSLAFEKYTSFLNLVSIICSDLNGYLYMCKHELRTELNGRLGMMYCVDVYGYKNNNLCINMDKHLRHARPVAWVLSDPEPHLEKNHIHSQLLGLKGDYLMEVIIQEHALRRLSERLDGILPGILHAHLYLSLKQPKTIRCRNGNFLIEYSLFGKKVGYFVATVFDNFLILRTFLFLTNNGTPEGEKLRKVTGLAKADKRYLNIDKLSTFLQSDIEHNGLIREIFTKAGCGSLFEIDKSVYWDKPQLSEKKLASFLVNYLNLNSIGHVGQQGLC